MFTQINNEKIKLDFNSGIKVFVDENRLIKGLDGSFLSTGYSLSTEKLVVGDISLSLYDNGSRYALAAVIDNTNDDFSNIEVSVEDRLPFEIKTIVYAGDNRTSLFAGVTAYSIERISTVNTFGVQISSSSNVQSRTLTWNNQVIGVSDEGQIEMVSVTLPSVDETRRIRISGMPVLVRRYGTDWYMVMNAIVGKPWFVF
jgi:hypothetical protein